MKRLAIMVCVALFFVIAVAVAVKTFIAHRQPYSPSQPQDISSDAVYIQGPNGHGLWESCLFQGEDIVCSIANVSGAVLHRGKFIPYKGAAPSRREDLIITQKSGDGWISLENGTYLIPAEHNEASRRYLDFMIGNAKSFDK